MANEFFAKDFETKKKKIDVEGQEITDYLKIISAEATDEQLFKGDMFAAEIFNSHITDFEKTKKVCDRLNITDNPDSMVHVSTFLYFDNMIYMTYYASNETDEENPEHIRARLVYCPVDDVENKTFLDIQAVGDECGGTKIDRVYDTILMKKDDKTLYILWTASADGNYYRLYRTFDIKTKTLGEVSVNKLKVGDVVNDFSATGIVSAFSENELGIKNMFSDIGIMQKISSREENGETYYYTGAYSGDLNFLVKSKDFETWEFVSQPDFPNLSQWENAVYVYNDKCYYFSRQTTATKYGFLTYYDLNEEKWAKPVLIEDCQSRSDFLMYDGELYLVFAPIDREHIGLARVDTDNLENTSLVFIANMHSSCFYPFIQYTNDGKVGFSYTVNRKHIRLSKFDLRKYIL